MRTFVALALGLGAGCSAATLRRSSVSISGVKNYEADCDAHCSNAAGLCHFCGPRGACCRGGDDAEHPHCPPAKLILKFNSGKDYHHRTCVPTADVPEPPVPRAAMQGISNLGEDCLPTCKSPGKCPAFCGSGVCCKSGDKTQRSPPCPQDKDIDKFNFGRKLSHHTCVPDRHMLLAAVMASGSVGNKGCPMDLPVKHDYEEAYFIQLFKLLQNAPPDGHSQEHYVEVWESELKCLYTMLLSQKCMGLESQWKSRAVPWRMNCINGEAQHFDAYNLMSKEEKDVFGRLWRAAGEKAVYKTMDTLQGKKEAVCMLMKIVDDQCSVGLSFAKPRLQLNKDDVSHIPQWAKELV